MARARLTALAVGLALAGAAAVLPGAADAAGSSPTISPSVKVVSIPKNGTRPDCPTGYECPLVKDPTTGGYKFFYLYTCNTYALSNWFGESFIVDYQTGGVTSYLYDQNHKELLRFKPSMTSAPTVKWDRVFFIKNC